MDILRELWYKKNTMRGRVDITFFFINIFLIICHMFLMGFYIKVGHIFMITINIFSLFIYIAHIFDCFRYIRRYSSITFIEIWIHILFAIVSFGWKACFQNWFFALLSAVFLITFSIDNEKKARIRSIIFSIIVVITYFVLPVLSNIIDFPIRQSLSEIELRIIFSFNNLISFFSIIMLAIFYTSFSRRREDELTRKADYDELTELHNRAAMLQISRKIINDAKNLKKSYSAAILDIDHFKKINDKYGHAAGDEVLKQLAAILRFYSIKGLVPSRWGGEEFVIIAPHNVKYAEFLKIMEAIRLKVSRTNFQIEEDKTINATISIGATHIKEYHSLTESLKKADDNLYIAKKSGRNQLVR